MEQTQSVEALRPTPGVVSARLAASDVNVNMCYQCGKCAAGCPVAFAMDYPPAQIIHAVRLGLDEMVLGSKTIWLCSACETCTTRCPQGVDVCKVMDTAKITAVRKGVPPAVRNVRQFHKAALGNVRMFGRMWELGVIALLKLRTGGLFSDVGLGMRMLLKGKLSFLPTFTGARRAGRIFSRAEQAERKGEERA